MSAPREKKQLSAKEPIEEKALTPEEREAAAKRTTKRYLIIGIVIAVLCAALLFWDTGIIQRNTTALSVNDTDYTAAEVSYYYNLVYQETYTYAQYGMNTFNVNLPAEEQLFYADPMTETIKSWADYFRDTTVDTMTNLTALYDAAIAAGYTAEDVADEVDAEMKTVELSATASGYDSLKQMLVASYGKLITPSNYRDIITRAIIANSYIEDYGASLEFSDEELDEYYVENSDILDTVEYGFLYFRAKDVEETDADGNELSAEEIEAAEEAALEEAKAKAEEVAEAWESLPVAERADAIEQLIEEYEPDSSSVVKSFSAGSLTSALSEWLLAEDRTDNEIGLVDYPDYGTYAILFHDRYLDETPSVNVHHILIKAEIDDGATTPTEAQMAAAKEEAEKVLAQWKAGAATQDSFAALADELSDDTRDDAGNLSVPGGKYENVYEGNFVTNFNNWLFHEGEREVGETGIVENDGDSSYYGYHVIYFAGENEGDFAWKVTARENLTSDQVTLYRDDLATSYTATEKSGMKFVD